MNSTLAILAVLDGISYAALVFLVSVGLSLIFGVLGVVNVAHGSLYAFGAYLAATLSLAIAPISPGYWAMRCYRGVLDDPAGVPMMASLAGLASFLVLGLIVTALLGRTRRA